MIQRQQGPDNYPKLSGQLHSRLTRAQCYSERNNWNALTDGRWKYIYHAYSGEEMLFDLAADPGELADLASNPSHAATLARWRGRLVEHLQERGPAWVKDGQLVPRSQQGIYSPNYPERER